MALRFRDFSLLHQFLPEKGKGSEAEQEQATKGAPGPLNASHGVTRWPPTGITDLALSNVDGLTYGELKDLGLEGVPDGMNLGDPNILVGPLLKEQIARRHGFVGQPEKVITTVGASEANFLLFGALLGKDGEGERSGQFGKVIIESPTYPPLLNIPPGLGAEVVDWPRNPEYGFKVDLDGLEELLMEHGPAMVVMTNLHNPSGAPTNNDLVKAIYGLVDRHKGLLVVDEIYRELEPGLETAATLGERCLVVSSISKVYGISGLRVGWIIGDPELLRPIQELKEYVSAVNSSVCEMLTLQALLEGDWLVERARSIKAENLPLVEAFCNSRPELEWTSTSSLVSFIKVNHPLGSLELTRRLKEKYKVMISAGEHFGYPGYLRIGYGCNPEVLEERLCRFGLALDELSLSTP